MQIKKRKIMSAVLASVLLAASVSVSASSFADDVDAINKAAQSVLMLEVYDANNELIRRGSGFVAFDNFTLVTNEHIIEEADLIIGTSDAGNQYMITKLIAVDHKTDIAILEFFSPTDLLPLKLIDKTELKRAEPVVAIGSPLGLKNSVSLGHISALFEEEGISYIHFTAPISPGSSGGTLFSDKGQVIGITTATLTDGQNINLAVSIDEVIKLYSNSHLKERIRLSSHSSAKSTPVPTATLKPTTKPTAKPTLKPSPIQHPQKYRLLIGSSKAFDHSQLKALKGYSYDKFDKKWDYGFLVPIENEFNIGFHMGGKAVIDLSPILAIGSDKSKELFLKSIELSVGEKIYQYDSPRFVPDSEFNFFHLGLVGKEMLTDISRASTASIRISMINGDKFVFNFSKTTFSQLTAWSKNILIYKVFDMFTQNQLSIADKSHNASVR